MLRLLLMAIGVYLGILVLMWLFQDRLLYLPSMPGRELQASPADRGWEYEDLELIAEDGTRLHAWWVPAPEARGSLIFFHGNAGNISHRLHSIEIFRNLGLSVLILDYRGYGQSEGRPSEAGLYQDARAAWDHLLEERGVPAEEVVLFGRSLGSGVAAWLGQTVTPAGVILESSFRSVPDMAQTVYPFLPARWLARMDYPTEDYVQNLEAPVLVIHSEDDEIIPFQQGRAVYQAANEPKQFLTLRGGHNTGFLDSREVYVSGLDDFLSKVLGEGD